MVDEMIKSLDELIDIWRNFPAALSDRPIDMRLAGFLNALIADRQRLLNEIAGLRHALSDSCEDNE